MYACDYLENGVLNVLRGVTFAAPAKVYLALYLNDPGEDGASGTEVSYAGYKRIEIDFSSPAETNGGHRSPKPRGHYFPDAWSPRRAPLRTSVFWTPSRAAICFAAASLWNPS